MAILTLTEQAIAKISALMRENDLAIGIKISVKSGGCSGMLYNIDYALHDSIEDEVIEQEGVRVFVDKKALLYIIGTQMDYNDDGFSEGFVFINPNEKNQCGCGKSFSV